MKIKQSNMSLLLKTKCKYEDDCGIHGMHSDKQLFSYQLNNDGVDTSMLD